MNLRITDTGDTITIRGDMPRGLKIPAITARAMTLRELEAAVMTDVKTRTADAVKAKAERVKVAEENRKRKAEQKAAKAKAEAEAKATEKPPKK